MCFYVKMSARRQTNAQTNGRSLNSNVEMYAKNQLGSLAEPLVIAEDVIVPIIVHHMNSGNKSYSRGSPVIPKNAPMADFIYEDVVLRSIETVNRYLCGEDELLKTGSQMTRVIVKHLDTYHGLLRSVCKETKKALHSKRTKQQVGGKQMGYSDLKDLVALNKELREKKERLRSAKSNAQLEKVIQQLENRQTEIKKKLKKVSQHRLTKVEDNVQRSKQNNGTLNSTKINEKMISVLNESTQGLLNTTEKCTSFKTSLNSKPTSKQHVFSSIPTIQGGKYVTLQCEDTKWSSINYKANNNSPVEIQGVTGKSDLIPFRTLFGDRLVKRRLVLHSFVERLNSVLYHNQTKRTKNQFLPRHPLYDRFEGLFIEGNSNKNKNIKNVGVINDDVDRLTWNEKLRSFGNEGPQDYWIQLLREMYDSRRVENIRKKTRSGPKQAKFKSASELTKIYENLRLPDNLGVTCYGYVCDPMDPSKQWKKSYHRFGRSWFCDDVTGDEFQLPFGCYNDSCAPPMKTMSNPNYHSNSGNEPSRITDKLMKIAVNNICTTVLQTSSKFGSQGRYMHIKTAYNGRSIGKMTPFEALRTFQSVRTAIGAQNIQTTVPYKFELQGNTIMLTTGHDLKISILESRNALRKQPVVAARFNNKPITQTEAENNENETKAATSFETNISSRPNKLEEFSNIRNILNKKNNKTIDLNALKNNSERAVALRKMLLGMNADKNWDETKLGGKKVTTWNFDPLKLTKLGAGLYKRRDDIKNDTLSLNRNFFMVDGEIYTNCQPTKDILLYGGSEEALGISKKFVEIKGTSPLRMPVIPLILPLNASDDSYTQISANAKTYFNKMFDDSVSGIPGLIQRQMDNVCIPLFKTGSLMKGTHYNDLMTRFLVATAKLDKKNPQVIENALQKPELYNIVRCLQFYLYIHVGLSTEEALKQIAKYDALRFSLNTQTYMYSLSKTLRLLGETGPMPQEMFKKIVKQYILTAGKKNRYMSAEAVDAEVAKLERKLYKFKLFGKEFDRKSFLPGFMGGIGSRLTPNRSMGVPQVQKLKPQSKLSKLRNSIVSPGPQQIPGTNILMAKSNARKKSVKNALLG